MPVFNLVFLDANRVLERCRYHHDAIHHPGDSPLTALPVRRVVLYKHGIGLLGYFERRFRRERSRYLDADLQAEQKSATYVKSLNCPRPRWRSRRDRCHYDSFKPLEQLLDEVAARRSPIRAVSSAYCRRSRSASDSWVQAPGGEPVPGILLGVDSSERQVQMRTASSRVVLVSLPDRRWRRRAFLRPARAYKKLEILDPSLRRDLDYYLRTVLSAKKKDARTFTFFAAGHRQAAAIQLSYTLEAR